MKLKKLQVLHLPGIDKGFVLDSFGPGANFVFGPNACGKSSLVRALGYLVGGVRKDDPPGLYLKADFESGQGLWRVVRVGPDISWEFEGKKASPPPLPDADLLRGIWFSMENLCGSDDRDRLLAEELKRTLAGGCDLDALKQSDPLFVGSRHGDRERNELDKAERDLRAVEAGYEVLRGEEAKIIEVERELDEARRAALRSVALEKALKLLEARTEVRQLEAATEAFPPGMDRISGLEKGILEDIERGRQRWEDERNAAVRSLEEAKERLRDTGLAEGCPLPRQIREASLDLQDAGRFSDQLAQKEDALDSARSAELDLLRSLGGREDAPELDPDRVGEADLLVRDFLQARERRDILALKCGDQTPAPEDEELDRHLMAGHALREWLSADGGPSIPVRFLLLLALTGGGLAVGMSFPFRAWLALLGGFLAVCGASLALILWGRGGRTTARDRFEATGLAAPGGWSKEDVERRAEEIDRARLELLRRKNQARVAAEAGQELQLAEAGLAELERKRVDLAAEVGFDPLARTVSLGHFVWILRDYQKAHRERLALALEADKLRCDLESRLEHVRAFLGPWCSLKGDESFNGLVAVLEDLRSRDAAASTERATIRSAEAEIRQAEDRLDELNERRRELFAEAGLEQDDVKELLSRCGLLEIWKGAREVWQKEKNLETFHRSELEGQEKMLELADLGERGRLEEELEKVRVLALGIGKKMEFLADIRARVDNAGAEKKLQKALSRVNLARESLAAKHESALFADLGRMLLDAVGEEYQEEHEPDVLRDARERFRRFTRSHFDFRLGAGRDFIARDLKQKADRDLSELSSATRMNLLLALRLAWSLHAQRGMEKLPLILDEALTNSDGNRFREVVRNLDDLVRNEGMQVFYLSARRYESGLWEAAVGSGLRCIDLSALRWPSEAASPEDYAVPEEKELPLPDGKSCEDYAAELGIPPLDPCKGEGSVHPFYLLRDNLPVLYRLMSGWGVTSLGQMQSLLEDRAAEKVFGDEALCLRLRGRCSVLHAWFEAWGRGRASKVDTGALERSGAVSANFMVPVYDLARECEGDAGALVGRLRNREVQGFGPAKINTLARWLEENGYVTSERPLSADERCREALLRAQNLISPGEAARVVSWFEASCSS